MTKLGGSLDELMESRAKAFSLQKVCIFGIYTLKALKALHRFGFVHNDIKPANILLCEDTNSKSPITLIDFGLSTPFEGMDKTHLPMSSCHFKGNIAFSSANALRSRTTSRRDDLISLVYLMLYMHRGSLIFLGIDQANSSVEDLVLAKEETSPKEMCSKKSIALLPFVEYVFSLGYEQDPDYDLMETMLHFCLEE
jgi:serine/threonine protein kinase